MKAQLLLLEPNIAVAYRASVLPLIFLIYLPFSTDLELPDFYIPY